jgi:hypothetical protein
MTYTAFMTFFFTHWFNYKGAAFGSLLPHTSEHLSPQGLLPIIVDSDADI